MFAVTIIFAGFLGFGLLVAPSSMQSALGYPAEEHYVAGVAYSFWFALGLLSVLGLRSPLKFWPLLLLQLTYKLTWVVAIMSPRLVNGGLPAFAASMTVLFVLIIIGDIIVIPWRNVFTK